MFKRKYEYFRFLLCYAFQWLVYRLLLQVIVYYSLDSKYEMQLFIKEKQMLL